MTKEERDFIHDKAAHWRTSVFESFRPAAGKEAPLPVTEQFPDTVEDGETLLETSLIDAVTDSGEAGDHWLSGIRVASAHLRLLEECVRMNAARSSAEAASLMIKLGLRANEHIISLHAEQREKLEKTRERFAGLLNADTFE